MRFILVDIGASPHWHEWHTTQWRATHVKPEGGAIDVFFFAPTMAEAMARLRKTYPLATFTHEDRLCPAIHA